MRIRFLTLFTGSLLSGESAIVLSNYLLMFSTVALVLVTIRETHKTMRKMVKENRFLARIIADRFVQPAQGTHRKDVDDE